MNERMRPVKKIDTTSSGFHEKRQHEFHSSCQSDGLYLFQDILAKKILKGKISHKNIGEKNGSKRAKGKCIQGTRRIHCPVSSRVWQALRWKLWGGFGRFEDHKKDKNLVGGDNPTHPRRMNRTL